MGGSVLSGKEAPRASGWGKWGSTLKDVTEPKYCLNYSISFFSLLPQLNLIPPLHPET